MHLKLEQKLKGARTTAALKSRFISRSGLRKTDVALLSTPTESGFWPPRRPLGVRAAVRHPSGMCSAHSLSYALEPMGLCLRLGAEFEHQTY